MREESEKIESWGSVGVHIPRLINRLSRRVEGDAPDALPGRTARPSSFAVAPHTTRPLLHAHGTPKGTRVNPRRPAPLVHRSFSHMARLGLVFVIAALPFISSRAHAQSCGGWSSFGTTDVARRGAAMATHAAANQVVLYGGIDSAGTRIGLLRLHNGSAWTNPGDSAPGRLAYPGMVYDSQRTRVVLFGGEAPTGASDKTWAWTGSVWNERTPAAGDPNPAGRFAHAMAYDPLRDRTLVHGGFGPNGNERSDFWSLNGQAWNQRVEGPTARAHHAMVFDPARGNTVLFGGQDFFPSSGTTAYFNDTWTWNGTAWTQLNPANRPSARSGHAMAWDASRSRVVLHGGFSPSNPNAPNETWEWNGSNWTLVSTATPQSGFGRVDHAMTNWPFAGNQVVSMGGVLSGSSVPTAFTSLWRAPVPPAITSGPSPSSASVNVGANVSFTISASGAGLQYQWWKRNSGAISGATGPTLTLTNVIESSAGSYYCVVTNACGSAQSEDAVLTVICPAPVLVQNITPSSLPLQLPGANVTLSIVASGGQNLSYRWTRNSFSLSDGTFGGTTISGSTTPTLTLSNLTTGAQGFYRCVVTSNCSSTTSSISSSAVFIDFIAMPPGRLPVLQECLFLGSYLDATVIGVGDDLLAGASEFVNYSISFPEQNYGDFLKETTDGGFKGMKLSGVADLSIFGQLSPAITLSWSQGAAVQINSVVPLESASGSFVSVFQTTFLLGGLPSDRFTVSAPSSSPKIDTPLIDVCKASSTDRAILTVQGYTPGQFRISIENREVLDYVGSGETPVVLSGGVGDFGDLTITRNEGAGDWDELAGGIVGDVRAFTRALGTLIVGGNFVTAGGMTVNHIAAWNGSQWSVLGEGFNGPVNALLVFNGEIIAAGEFTHAIGDASTPLLRIARWDGAAWRPVGAGFDNTVHALGEHEGHLYAGGAFTQSGAQQCDRLAVLINATTGWQPAGAFNGDVYAILSEPNQFPPNSSTLWVGGAFTELDGQPIRGLAAMSPFGWYETYAVPGVVRSLEFQATLDEFFQDTPRVIFAGDFQDASRGINNIAAIEWGSLVPLNNGLQGPVYSLYAHGEGRLSVLVAGGDFLATATHPASRIARLDGDVWTPIKEGANGPVRAITTFGDDVVAGGAFTMAGVRPAAGLARFRAAGPAPACPGDANGDGTVNFSDLNAVLSAFGQSGADLPGDVNGDGIVNFADLNLVLSNFGVACDP